MNLKWESVSVNIWKKCLMICWLQYGISQAHEMRLERFSALVRPIHRHTTFRPCQHQQNRRVERWDHHCRICMKIMNLKKVAWIENCISTYMIFADISPVWIIRLRNALVASLSFDLDTCIFSKKHRCAWATNKMNKRRYTVKS